MHFDYLLFTIGIISCILGVLLIIYLAFSKKKTRFYKQLLDQDTEVFDAYSSTISQLSEINEGLIEDTVALGYATMDETGLIQSDDTVLLKEDFSSRGKVSGFNMDSLEGRYSIDREIYGGGMSRVFLVTNVKLGNQWILKYIDRKTGSLANEENILKLLNNISLPKIVDIFNDENGIYIIQSYIEGISLDKVIEVGKNMGQSMVLDWAEELGQVLSYLHNLKPLPIVHCDLKPSNIMVTHDNKLVLIDFGISKHLDGLNDEVKAVTYKYAAPEQLKHNIKGKQAELINERFGDLPEERFNWRVDERTDIYSYGVMVFELVTGIIPTFKNKNIISEFISKEFAEIILKCLEEDPKDRYQTTKELLGDLQKIKDIRTTMVRSLVFRRVALVSTLITLLVSGTSLASGAYVMQQENLSLVYMEPNSVKISEQQSAEIAIQKVRPNGKVIDLDSKEIKWTLDNNIAKVEGNRIAGMNTGSTELIGKYRNKIITLNVDVVKRMDGMVDISLAYLKDNKVKKYLGTGNREHIDGNNNKASFVSLEGITKTEDGTIYISDAGVLKKIEDNQVESIFFEPSYITPKLVRSYKNELYILSNPWEDEDEYFYGIIRFSDDGIEGLYIGNGVHTSIEDFAFTNDGKLYFIENNIAMGITSIKHLNLDSYEVEEICEVDDNVKAITVDLEGNIYVAIPDRGVIQKVHKTSRDIEYFAGVDGERHFVDGSLPLFYEPLRLHYANNSIYVLDFNIIRRIVLEDGMAVMVETIAGEISTETNPGIREGSGNSTIFPMSKEMDFYPNEDSILLTDPKNSIIWELSL